MVCLFTPNVTSSFKVKDSTFRKFSCEKSSVSKLMNGVLSFNISTKRNALPEVERGSS